MNRPRLVIDNGPADTPESLDRELERAIAELVTVLEAHGKAMQDYRRVWARVVAIKHRIWAEESGGTR